MPSTSSPSAWPDSLPPDLTLVLTRLTDQEAEEALFTWPLWARPNQLPPSGSWRTWLVLAGRGFGKTRTGAELVRAKVEAGVAARVALVGQTAADVRDVMIEGESGLLSVCPPWFAPRYEPSKRRLTWPNGAIATAYSADEPRQLRGPQHDFAWADELASWSTPEAWDQLMFGLRLGADPRVIVTTTPRPTKAIRDLLGDPTTVVTRGSTYDNRANLAPAFFEQIIRKYEGTRLGRQELHAEVLDDVPGALWTRAMLDAARVALTPPELVRIVVGIDPAVTSGEDSDETGIIVAGKDATGFFHVLGDRSCRMTPDGWARRAVTAFDELNADRIVAEVNNGGDLVEATLRTIRRSIPYRAVRASRGKRVRAEPIAALYEQRRVHHYGDLAQLEDQMVTFTPDGMDGSPDRVDALVWALTELSETPTPGMRRY